MPRVKSVAKPSFVLAIALPIQVAICSLGDTCSNDDLMIRHHQALLQIKQTSEGKPVVINVVIDHNVGDVAPLSEEGFQKVRKECCTPQMAKFIARALNSTGRKVCNEGGLMGFALFADCTDDTAIANYAALVGEAGIGSGSLAESGECPWIGKKNEVCTPLPESCPSFPDPGQWATRKCGAVADGATPSDTSSPAVSREIPALEGPTIAATTTTTQIGQTANIAMAAPTTTTTTAARTMAPTTNFLAAQTTTTTTLAAPTTTLAIVQVVQTLPMTTTTTTATIAPITVPPTTTMTTTIAAPTTVPDKCLVNLRSNEEGGKKCVNRGKRAVCAADAGDQGKRWAQYPKQKDSKASFEISTEDDGTVCAERKDKVSGPWSFNLVVECDCHTLMPTPATESCTAGSVEKVIVGTNLVGESKCVDSKLNVKCDADAGNQGKRLGTSPIITDSKDTFDIEVHGSTVCAIRTDTNRNTWWVPLELACECIA